MSDTGTGKKKRKYITRAALQRKYGVTRAVIEKYFPKPQFRTGGPGGGKTPVWDVDVAMHVLSKPEVKKAVRRAKLRKGAESRISKELTGLLSSFTPDILIERARELDRRFVLHVGPTNSGKTHDAMAALRKCDSGVYLGPLRLLALEMFDRLNADGCPCDLLTGEEKQEIPFAKKTSSTIELCDFSQRYDVAVIDEAQMIADPDRGAHWLDAICLVDASEVHICLAPEALSLIQRLVEQIGAPFEIVRHERLVPLVFSGFCDGLREVKPGDAVIAFSRKNVLSISAHLEQAGYLTSVIYGALPPEARREEVRKYYAGETSVVVATDAIGMGISLPIKRIVFSESSKFDGKHRRMLNPSEIKQIAGRAGRYGMYDLGEVLTMVDTAYFEREFKKGVPDIAAYTVSFPKDSLDSRFAVSTLLKEWQALPESEAFRREDMSEALFLLKRLTKIPRDTDKKLLFDLITCPVNVKSDELVYYWQLCADAILRKQGVPYPFFGTDTLENCELQYGAYDILHQLLRRVGEELDFEDEKSELCRKINEFLINDKERYIRHCRICGRVLPINSQYSICDRCFKKKRYDMW